MPSLRAGLLVVLSSVLTVAPILGQTARDRAVEINAVVQSSPARIALTWNAAAYPVTQQMVSRRLKGATNWGLPATTANTATTFTDSNVAVGTSYEYRVTRTFNGAPESAFGYISAGIAVPLVTYRGRAILLVDDTMAAPLAAELARFESDLVGDGWVVVRREIARTATPPSVRAIIQSIYTANPSDTRAVILFGHIPVPYSGNEFIDGHTDHAGAWPTDLYYGEMDGTWTDSTVDNSSASDPRNRNIPGDGKFDQTAIPSDVELQVGRIDLANMPAFEVTETELLRRYLDRDHAYRHRLGGFANVERRGLVDDDVLGYFGGEAFAVSAWRTLTACVGSDNVQALDWFGTLQTGSYLWAYGCGYGSYSSAESVGATSDFATKDSRAVFTMLFGSYFGDWDTGNCLLRAPLGGTASSLGLVSCWAGRPHWFLHSMALGETVGYAARITQNNSGSALTGYASSFGQRSNHVALMGDPTLRLYPISPPTNHLATIAPGGVSLSWSASPDAAIAGYLVARADSPDGPFIPLQSELVAGTSFLDETVESGERPFYLVRAVKIEVSPTGSFFNSSQGAFSGPASTHAAIAVYPPAVNRSLHPDSGASETITISNSGLGPLIYTISAPPGNTLPGWLTVSASEGTATPGGAQQVKATLDTTGLAPGDYSANLQIYSNAEGQPSVLIPVRLTVGNTPVENWRLSNFGSAENSGDAADTANIDRDEGSNLLEYSAGRDPKSPETIPLVTTKINAGGYLEIRFERLESRTDLRYLVEAATELAGEWLPIASGIHGAPVIATGAHSSIETGTGDVRTVTVEDSAPAASFTTRFLRLRVVRD